MSKGTYIAGPMSGIKQLNFPAFMDAAEALRGQGIDVVNPAELDSPEEFEWAMQSDGTQYLQGTWGDYLARGVKVIADSCDSICLLPGWAKSKGARFELFVALNLNYDVFLYNPVKKTMDTGPKHSVLHCMSTEMRNNVWE